MKKLFILSVLFFTVTNATFAQKLIISNTTGCTSPAATMYIRAHDNTYTSCACIGFQSLMSLPVSATYNNITDFDNNFPACTGTLPGWWEGCSTYNNICVDNTLGNWDYDLITVSIGGTSFPVAHNGSCLSGTFSSSSTQSTLCGTITVDFYKIGSDYYLDVY